MSIDARTTAPTTARAAVATAAVCLVAIVVPSSLSGVSIALPEIGRAMGVGLDSLQWVVNAYNVAAASSMLAAGSLADIFGRRRLFALGAALFGLGSAVSALGGHLLVLDISRGVAGVGAAMLVTSGTAIIATAFAGNPAAARRAFALLGTCAGAGLAIGPSTAGLLVGAFGWRSVFVAQMAVAAVALAAAVAMPESRDDRAGGVDRWGTATFTAGLTLLATAVAEAPRAGWGSVTTVLPLAGFAVAMVLFVFVERRLERRGRRPMCELSLFGNRTFLGLCLIPVVVSFGFAGLLVLLPPYLSGAGGFTVTQTGLVMLLLTAPVLVFPLLGARLLARRVRPVTVFAVSLAVLSAGVGWLALVDTAAGVTTLCGPLLTIGAGMGLSMGLVDGQAIGAVAPANAGVASGMLNTGRLASEAVAMAIMAALLVTLLPTMSYAEALRATLWLSLALCVLGSALVIALIARPAPITEP